jgi:predicted amino acid racemase
LSRLAALIEATFDISIETVSGGNSANLEWASGSANTGRINNLLPGESILLGREALQRHVIEGLHTDAITLIAEVIESKVKPMQPWGDLAENAFGTCPAVIDRGTIR